MFFKTPPEIQRWHTYCLIIGGKILEGKNRTDTAEQIEI